MAVESWNQNGTWRVAYCGDSLPGWKDMHAQDEHQSRMTLVHLCKGLEIQQ
jgi:hypothetical protein